MKKKEVTKSAYVAPSCAVVRTMATELLAGSGVNAGLGQYGDGGNLDGSPSSAKENNLRYDPSWGGGEPSGTGVWDD